MQSQDIRLRLVIRRHGLPEIKLVWPCSCAEDVTIAKVLEQVNEVVPLESGEWGLEDYAVELEDGKGGSFECLHFQQVGRILKDEDQVIIRSLLAGDLKRRRLSGRHQISDDGRHLIDGLAFGRSWLRTPRDRPHIDLPPRKRVRFSNDVEDEEEEQEQLLLGSLPLSQNGSLKTVRTVDPYDDDSDDDDDDDFRADREYLDGSVSTSDTSPRRRLHMGEHTEHSDMDDGADEEDDDDEDLEAEMRFLRQDADAGDYDIGRCLDLLGKAGKSIEIGDTQDEEDDIPDSFPSEDSVAAHGYSRLPVDILVAVFRFAFSELSDEDIKFALTRTNKDMRKTYMSLAMLQKPSQDFDRMIDDASLILAQESLQHAKETTNVLNGIDATSRLRIESREKVKGPSKPLIQEVEDSDEIEDSEFLRESQLNGGVSISIATSRQKQDLSSNETSESDFEESEPDSKEDSSSEEESESGSENDSSDASGNSSSSNEEDRSRASNFPTPTTAPKKPKDASSENRLPSDKKAGNSGSSANNGKGRSRDARAPASSSSESSEESSDSDSTEESDSEPESESESESESGSNSESESESEVEEISSKRPEKSAHPARKLRDVTTTLAAQAQETDTPPSAGLTRTQKRNARRKRNKALKEGLEQSNLTNGDQDGAAQDDFLARKEALLAAILNESAENAAPNGEAEMGDAPLSVKVPEDQPQGTEADANRATEAKTPDPKDTPRKRSSRVDLGAGRRLVFGALGLKAPATKADEQKIRDSLMKDVRPLVNPRTLQNGDGDNAIEAAAEAEEDPDAWREKIIYKAVECCHENMVLSEPPFPFVQRWDPQQKYQTMRKRKRASENYQADTSYDDSAFYYSAHEPGEDYYAEDAGEISKKKKRKPSNKQNGTMDQDEQDVILNYDEVPLKSSQFTDLDDLPSLPEDIKALPLLTPESAQPGMVITWNQLLMSKATKWQPELLPITGLIIPGGEDGSIHIMLARRDRENNEKVYDEVTGKRVYDKFEAPDLDEASGEDGEEEEDDGFRSLQWAEMLEPRILQQAPVDDNTEAAATESEMPSGHDQVSELQPEADASESQPSTGQVRAAVENDLMHDSFGTIQSGQRLPRLDMSMSEVQISTASDSFEFVGQLNSNNPATTPGAQSNQALTAAANPSDAQSAKSNYLPEREDGAAADQEAELAHSVANAAAEGVSNSRTPLPKMAEPSEDQRGEQVGEQAGQGEVGEEQREEQTSAQSGSAIHSDAVIAASQFSVPSGRQPRTAFSLEDGAHHDTLIPETLLHPHESTPPPNGSRSPASSSGKSSPFPSLEEIFMSAQPTQNSDRKLNTPSFSASQGVVPATDMEYEEAMRKLDEGHESDHSPEQKQEEQEEADSNVLPNATQPSVRTRAAMEELPTLSTALLQPAKKTNDKTSFAIPAGSQVIVLSSSPSSSADMPNENSESEAVRPSPSRSKRKLPTGPGWVRKGTRDERDAMNGPRKGTVAASTRASRRGRAEAVPPLHAPLVTAVKKGKGRKGR